jgi:hypothetical protein
LIEPGWILECVHERGLEQAAKTVSLKSCVVSETTPQLEFRAVVGLRGTNGLTGVVQPRTQKPAITFQLPEGEIVQSARRTSVDFRLHLQVGVG